MLKCCASLEICSSKLIVSVYSHMLRQCNEILSLVTLLLTFPYLTHVSSIPPFTPQSMSMAGFSLGF